MRAEDHRAQAGDQPLKIGVITVSSTRTEADDASGTLIATLFTAANHRVVSRGLVEDDVEAIRRTVQRLVDDGVELVVLTGGTGLAAHNVTPEALEPMFVRPIPGFGELFRMLSYEAWGAAAMLSRATAGVIGRTVVFALPDARKACRLAVERLVLPEARHVVHQASEHQGVLGRGQGWQHALASAGARLVRGEREALPDSLATLRPVLDVLDHAGEHAVAELGEWRYSLWGYPDLLRPSSRVLAISPGGSVAEVVALHRHPESVGTCVRGEGGWVTSRDRPVAEVAGALTGRPPPHGGSLFAVEARVAYVERDGQVFRWDGRLEEALGSPTQAICRLIREWSTS